MKIVFMGTPDFAAASLHHLLAWDEAGILAVYCQPDRQAGRGRNVQIGPVKQLALEHNLPVLQPLNFKAPAELENLKALGADIFVVAAYGLILPQVLLDIPPLGVINVHSSLLPLYRGAAPVQRAVMNGEITTGVTIMDVVYKLDSGDILMQRALGIGVDQTAGEVQDELAEMGGALLVKTLERIRDGRVTRVPQDESRSTYASKLGKADGVLDFSRSARVVHNQARGVTPWPGAQITIGRCGMNGKGLEPVKALVEKGRVLEEAGNLAPAGTILPLCGDILPVSCSSGLYGIEKLRPSSGKSMTAPAFSNGYLKNCSSFMQA